MSSPYSGATPAGTPDVGPMTTPITTITGYAEPTQNYAADYSAGQPASGDLGTPITESGRPDVEGTSVGALIGEVTKDLSTLMRQELELAKAEIKIEAKKAGQGAGMMDDFANWLQNREPADLLEEVRRFARRKPGVFLLGAAAAGVLAGRLTNGVRAAHTDSGQSDTGMAGQ